MGFGNGIDTPGRRGPAVDGVPGGWILSAPTLPQGGASVGFVTPLDTAPLRRLWDLTTFEARLAHAQALVTARTPTDARRSQRDLVGDARDLMVHALRKHLALGDSDFWVANEDGGTGRASETTAPPGYVRPDLIVHIGPTRLALDVLGDHAFRDDGRVPGLYRGWRGRLAELDGDGYVHACLRRDDRADRGYTPPPSLHHLFIVGGSDYGTYFGVAAFLRRWLRAVWLYPGEHGEVIPQAGTEGLMLSPPPNVLEEPSIRSRTFGLMTRPDPYYSGVEIDEARTWMLRNRLRPDVERYNLLYTVRNPPEPERCPPNPRTAAFLLTIRQTEERIPSGHNLDAFLSPTVPSFANDVDTGVPRYDSHRWFYPDVRPRAFPAGTEPPLAVSTPGLPALLGTQLEPALTTTPVARTANDPCWPILASTMYPLDRATTVPATEVVVLPEGHSRYVPYNARMNEFVQGQFARVALEQRPEDGTYQRYIPKSYLQTHGGRGIPFPNWHPCMFRFDRRLPPGLANGPSRLHTDLVYDLALQVRIALSARAVHTGDRAISLALADGGVWCECAGCTQVDDQNGGATAFVFYQRRYIASPVSALNFSALEAVDAPGGWTVPTLRARAGMAIRWDGDPRTNPFADMTLDALALRGLLVSDGYSNRRSRRVLCLMNAVAEMLDHLGPTPMESGLPVVSDPPVLSFHAYNEFMAPPMQGIDPGGPVRLGDAEVDIRPLLRAHGELCHPSLFPYLTGTRDTAEFVPSGTTPFGLTLAQPAEALQWRSRAPETFNYVRWRNVARQVGYYEYHYGNYHLVPALYTTRIVRAIDGAARQSRGPLRGYHAEVQPNWGLQAPMLWELAQALYTPTERVAELRGEFSAAAFGPAAGAMTRYFDLCEAAWAATRDRWPVYDTSGATRYVADRRERNVSGSFDGGAMAGRLGYLSQFDGWHEETMVAGRGLRSRLLQCWDALSEALVAARGAGATERTRYVERVQVFRQSFGLTLLVALWSRPLRQAFEVVRAHAGNRALLRRVNAMVRAGERGAPVRVVQASVTEAKASFATSGLGLQKATLPGALMAEVDVCLGTVQAPGLRPLRNQVNRFLSSGGITVNASNAASTFPILWAHRAALGEATLTELGLGLFPGAGPLADNAPIPNVPPTGLHRALGFYPPSVINYANWWRTTAALVEVRRREVIRRGDGDSQGLGWIFKAAREVAQAVVLYGEGYPNGDPSTIVRSGMGSVTVAAAAIEPYAVRIMEG